MQIVISGTYSLNDFKEDLKLMCFKAGVKGDGVVFLLTDSQITNERFFVYINELLASGYIPDLFTSEEIDNVVSAVIHVLRPVVWFPIRKRAGNSL